MKFVDLVMEEKDLLRDSGLVFFSGFIARVILFFANLYLSKLFGHVMFGAFKTVLYISMLLPSLIDIGMSITLAKYIADPKYKKEIGHLVRWFFGIRVVCFVLLLLVMFLAKDIIAVHFLHDKSLSYLVIAGMIYSFASFFGVLRGMVVGYENFKLFSISVFLTNVLTLIFGCALGYYFGVFYAVVGFGIAGIAGNLACLKFLVGKGIFKVREKIDTKKVFFGYSLPMHMLSIPGYFVNAVVPFLSLFFSPEVMGYYSFAFMFYFMTAIIPGSIQSVLFPKVSRLNSNGNGKDAEKSLKRILKMYTPIVAVGLVGILVFSEMFVGIVASEYLPGVVIFKVMVSLGLLFGYFVIYSSYLKAKGDVKKTAVVVLVQNLLLFVISFVVLQLLF